MSECTSHDELVPRQQALHMNQRMPDDEDEATSTATYLQAYAQSSTEQLNVELPQKPVYQ